MFDLDRYQAGLSANMAIKPDDKSPTASGKVMKSGYPSKVKIVVWEKKSEKINLQKLKDLET